jgi:hypothetical protein
LALHSPFFVHKPPEKTRGMNDYFEPDGYDLSVERQQHAKFTRIGLRSSGAADTFANTAGRSAQEAEEAKAKVKAARVNVK